MKFRAALEKLRGVDWFIPFLFACLPLFYKPVYYRDYAIIWEGAYRLSLGQLPHADFTMPLGFGSLLLPALFMKVFGPTFRAMEFAQVLINLGLGLSFATLLWLCGLSRFTRNTANLVFGLTFTSSLVTVWYNTSAFCFELLALVTLVSVWKMPSRSSALRLALSAALCGLTLMTKQDYGILAIALCSSLTLGLSYKQRTIKPAVVFLVSLLGFLILWTAPFWGVGIFSQINFGQAPHGSRFHFASFWSDTLEVSWYRRYALIFSVLIGGAVSQWKRQKQKTLSESEAVFTSIVFFLLFQNVIVFTTSGLKFTTQFVHGVAMAWITFILVDKKLIVRPIALSLCFLSFFFWGRGAWHSYSAAHLPTLVYQWAPSPIRFSEEPLLVQNSGAATGQYLPPKTAEMTDKLATALKPRGRKILNMTELTYLAKDWGFEPPLNVPLWYHMGTTMFDADVVALQRRILAEEFDLILIQNAHAEPTFPKELWQTIEKTYALEDSFRGPYAPANISVYKARKFSQIPELTKKTSRY